MIETFYVHLEFAGAEPWSVNLPFSRAKCGVCCALDDFLCAGKLAAKPPEHLEVFAKLQALFDELGKIWEADEAKYDQHIQKTPCPFKTDNMCSIYDIRPQGCRMYPKTAFGMQTTDCPALKRFKKQRAALVKGRRFTETYHRTVSLEHSAAEPIKPVALSKIQYQACLAKLHAVDMTPQELAGLNYFNAPST
jgi:Fe-S-cluster containining protein